MGRQNKNVEIDDSKFGWRKYNSVYKMIGQWVFCAVEGESGKYVYFVVTGAHPPIQLSVTVGWPIRT
jgi:hypothetical protein